jgi:hypothetical protein
MLPVVQGNVNAHKIAVPSHSTLHMCTQPIFRVLAGTACNNFLHNKAHIAYYRQ